MCRLSVSLCGAAALLLLATQSRADFATARNAEPAFRQIGVASWYGPGFHGRKTASGKRFDQNDLTAAHRSLPSSHRSSVTRVWNNASLYKSK